MGKQTNPVHFFKYMKASTALKVLQSCTLRWSSAGVFNDPFDSQFDLHQDYNREATIQEVLNNHWMVYSGAKTIEAKNTLGRALLFSHAHRNPNVSEEEFKRTQRGAIEKSLDAGSENLPALQGYFREKLKDAKFLCLSDVSDNILMWSHYAGDHTGVVVRLTDLKELNSAWGAARPVRYEREMPRLLNQAELVRFLSGEAVIDGEEALKKVVLTKAVDWSYEREWRVVLHGQDPAERHADIAFDPRAVTGICFGCRIETDDRTVLLAVAKKTFPHADLFEAKKSEREFAIEFASEAAP